MADFLYRAPDGHADLRAHAALMAQAFLIPEERALEFTQRHGAAGERVLVRDGSVVAGLSNYRMKQHFGGRAVPCGGVAGVAVAAHERGGGAGMRLMRELLLEEHAAGVALSALYPATLPFYRKLGYERAGSRLGFRLPTSLLRDSRTSLTLRPLGKPDHGAIAGLYRAWSLARAGTLEREAILWYRVLEQAQDPLYAVGAFEGGSLVGYVVYTQDREAGSFNYELRLRDFVFLTHEAGQALEGFLARHDSVTNFVHWHGGPSDGLCALLEQKGVEPRTAQHWMLRIVDLPGALRARGFAPGMHCTVAFSLEDDLLADNAGVWTLRVENGAAELKPGGTPAVHLNARGMAALYTGFQPLSALQALGLARVEHAVEAQRLEACFAGPAPFMSDFF